MKLKLSMMCAALASGSVHAQDTRVVHEPVVPPACAVLLPEADPHNDAARIQGAIDKCAPGHSLHLAPSNEKHAFVSGPLTLKSGVTLVIDRGATLHASTDPSLFDKGNGTCGTNDQKGRGCRPLITVENARGSGVMGDGVIDGQGGHLIDGKNETWWQIARRAQKENTRQNNPRLIEVFRSQDFTLYRITLKNSPNFHVTVNNSDGFTAWGVKIDTPHDARNTDGIDPISSRKNVTIAHSWISTGDDNVAVKSNASGPAENISILHNHFYSGHGMSIGSETNGGVHRMLVDDLTLDGTTSGLRIKSNDTRGGKVDTVVYRDVCLRATTRPIDIFTHYEQGKPGQLVPDYADVTFERVHSVTPGRVLLQGYDEQHPLRATFRDVVFDGGVKPEAQFARLDGAINAAGAKPVDCSARFVPFPAEPVKNTRPQLTAEQAKAYDYREVMKYVGPFGHERVDPWDPLADPLAKGAAFKPDYVVDLKANADNAHTFNSVQAAVSKAVSDNRSGRVYILVKPGVYHELVYVPASAPVTLYGEGDPSATRIAANLDASVTGAEYDRRFGAQFAHSAAPVQAMYDSVRARPDMIGTFGTQVVWVQNQGFQARGITLENEFNRVANGPAGARGVAHQALALRVDGADKAQFENVRLLGRQDTLYVNSADHASTVRSFFNKAYIEGDVDFIFGDTIAYFNDCDVKQLGGRAASYIGAPNTSRFARYGLVFNGCRFTSDTPDGHFYFARQWFHNERCTPYGAMAIDGYSCRLGDTDVFTSPNGTIRKFTLESVGKMVVLNSRIGKHINRANPWADWNNFGTLSYRPAQYSSDDWWDNLTAIGWDPATVLGEGPRPSPADVYLAEYNNTNE